MPGPLPSLCSSGTAGKQGATRGALGAAGHRAAEPERAVPPGPAAAAFAATGHAAAAGQASHRPTWAWHPFSYRRVCACPSPALKPCLALLKLHGRLSPQPCQSSYCYCQEVLDRLIQCGLLVAEEVGRAAEDRAPASAILCLGTWWTIPALGPCSYHDRAAQLYCWGSLHSSCPHISYPQGCGPRGWAPISSHPASWLSRSCVAPRGLLSSLGLLLLVFLHVPGLPCT